MTGRGTVEEPYEFWDDFQSLVDIDEQWVQAFDYCRERDRPIIVWVDGQIARIFPSGHCTVLEYRTCQGYGPAIRGKHDR